MSQRRGRGRGERDRDGGSEVRDKGKRTYRLVKEAELFQSAWHHAWPRGEPVYKTSLSQDPALEMTGHVPQMLPENPDLGGPRPLYRDGVSSSQWSPEVQPRLLAASGPSSERESGRARTPNLLPQFLALQARYAAEEPSPPRPRQGGDVARLSP